MVIKEKGIPRSLFLQASDYGDHEYDQEADQKFCLSILLFWETDLNFRVDHKASQA